MITFAVVSTAEIAKAKVIPALQSVTSTTLIGISSRDKQRAQAFIDEQCHSSSTGMTHDEVLSSPSIDAVYIPLPSKVRNDFIIKALQNDKHVYSEKPHGGTVLELKSVLDLAAGRNLQWMDGTMWYHSNRTKAMEEKLFQSDCLGKVKRVSASFTWGGGGLVDRQWVEGGNGRTDPEREAMGMLGDSGHYPISAVAWAFGWELPTNVRATHTKLNSLGAIVECEATLCFPGGGRAVIDTSCLLPHRSQFEVVCEKGVLKVDDLVGGQGRSGNFGAYDAPFVGSSSFVVGDYLGKDKMVQVEPCDHVKSLVTEFSNCVQTVKEGGKINMEWSKRSLVTHTIMCAIFESAMRGGVNIELKGESDNEATQYVIEGETFNDIPTRIWNK
mmetsp:Transcript_5720/g.12457  ORF Transcript_5720/g.12457 Transcript_5720/m.12457 type:complete len:386 (-) Transcript_5720:100-1257(-)